MIWKALIRRGSLWLLAVILLAGGNPGWAVTGIDQRVFRVLSQAQELADQEQYSQALATLDSMKDSRLSGYERAQKLNVRAYIQTRQENYRGAIGSYQQLLGIARLPDGLVKNALRMLVQLNMAESEYPAALRYTDRLLALDKVPDPAVLGMKAMCHYQLEELGAALTTVQRAIELELGAGRTPAESWYLLENAIYHGREQYREMPRVLRTLIAQYPKDRYVYTLATVYGQLDRSREQLLLLEPLYESGYITEENQLAHLASLFMAHDVPEKGARLLERGMKNGSIEKSVRRLDQLGQAWLLAREPHRAIEPLTRAAAQSDSGELFVRVAQVHINLAQWQPAERALKRALAADRLRNRGNALLLLGMSQYNQGHLDDAIGTFEAARKIDAVSVNSANWLDFLRRERQLAER